MYKLNLPSYHINIKSEEGKNFVFDVLRKKFVLLTPEEWVRQHFVHLLIQHYQYPKSLIKLESGLKYNKLKKRSDIIVYDREGKIFLIVECKSADVSISQKVFEQVTMYNDTLKAKYIVVTNGLKHFCCSIDHQEKKFKFMDDLPAF
jgi:hypothetical protein